MASEKRLIDANALGIGKAKREAFDNPAYADGWNSAIDIIENAPTVDAVEVVRCRECEFCKYNSSSENYKCMSMNGMYGTVDPDGFCSYGERRENEYGAL